MVNPRFNRTKDEIIVESVDEMDDVFHIQDLSHICSQKHKGIDWSSRQIATRLTRLSLAEKVRQLKNGEGSIWQKLS